MSFFSPNHHRYSPSLASPGGNYRHHPYAYQPAASPTPAPYYYSSTPSHCFSLRKMLWDRTKQLPKDIFKQVMKWLKSCLTSDCLVRVAIYRRPIIVDNSGPFLLISLFNLIILISLAKALG